jgi:hypothetical protein
VMIEKLLNFHRLPVVTVRNPRTDRRETITVRRPAESVHPRTPSRIMSADER